MRLAASPYCCEHVSALQLAWVAPQRGGAAQVATAREMWATEDGHVIDDCTIIVVFLEMVPVLRPRPVTIQLGQPGAALVGHRLCFRLCFVSALSPSSWANRVLP